MQVIHPKGNPSKLKLKCFGMYFKVLETFRANAFRLDLPPDLYLYTMFSVFLLCSHCDTLTKPEAIEVKRVQQHSLEKILSHHRAAHCQ